MSGGAEWGGLRVCGVGLGVSGWLRLWGEGGEVWRRWRWDFVR